MRWRYTENWSFQVNHRETSSDSGETLTQEFTFQDEVFEAGSFVGTGVQRASASVCAPLPNFGVWYMHSWSPKWTITTRLDWLDVTFE